MAQIQMSACKVSALILQSLALVEWGGVGAEFFCAQCAFAGQIWHDL